MKNFVFITLVLCSVSCHKKPSLSPEAMLDEAAAEYVTLGLSIGQYDAPFIDAYYGPDSLKPTQKKLDIFPKDSFLLSTQSLHQKVDSLKTNLKDSSLLRRAEFLVAQLQAYEMRIKIFTGEKPTFDEETQTLYGVVTPTHSMEYFDSLLINLDENLPGDGTINERYNSIIDQFIIPEDKVDTVLKVAIEESKRRTMRHISLPENETFKMELVNDKPWGGYNWYQGDFTSLIQINTDLPIYITRAIDVGSHESYPGHHVYNMLLEEKLYKEKSWVESSMYPLYSPQSLIAEGTANFGVEMIFPGKEKVKFCKDVLLQLAGLDTTGISNYFYVQSLVSELSFVNNEVGRGYLNGELTDEEAIEKLIHYGLRTRDSAEKFLSFIQKYRSYIINYNYGKGLVRRYIENNGGTPDNPEKRWKLFTWILSNQVLPNKLQ